MPADGSDRKDLGVDLKILEPEEMQRIFEERLALGRLIVNPLYLERNPLIEFDSEKFEGPLKNKFVRFRLGKGNWTGRVERYVSPNMVKVLFIKGGKADSLIVSAEHVKVLEESRD